jgi:predicted dehydrogenase
VFEVTEKSTRRQMLKNSVRIGTAIAAPLVVPATVFGAGGRAAPSERITLGVIGAGSRASYDLIGFLKQPDCQCLAVCDVQATRRKSGKQQIDANYGNNDCATCRDFRELLARRDIDAVLIATGDRWHAQASILAAGAGKDIYCEKPCGLSIGDFQALDNVIRKTGRVFQTGTQRRTAANFQAAVRLAQSGKLGRLQTLVASAYRPCFRTDWLPGEPTPSPDVVDWDLWLGPAPWRRYNHQYVEGRGWQGHWDFTAGVNLLDWGAHTVDLCQWANNADDSGPVEYETSKNTIIGRYANGATLVIDCLESPFGQRQGWVQSLGTCPVRFVGDQGWVETGDSGLIEAHPASLKEEVKDAIRKRERGLDVSNHARNFLDCVKSRAKPVANSHVMRHSHSACLAAATAWLLDRKLKYDPAKEAFVGDDEANGLRCRAARSPWAAVNL